MRGGFVQRALISQSRVSAAKVEYGGGDGGGKEGTVLGRVCDADRTSARALQMWSQLCVCVRTRGGAFLCNKWTMAQM